MGAGLALYVSALALTGTAVRARYFTTADEGELLTAALAVALIALARVAALLTFTVDYLTKDARRGWTGLAFPGDGPRGHRRERRVASAAEGRRDARVVAFVCNTVIIVVALSLVTG